MKKLLGILAAVGLTATASTSVVACTTVNKTVTNLSVDADGNATFNVNDLQINKNYTQISDIAKDYAMFDTSKDNKLVSTVTFSLQDSKDTTTSFKKNKKYNFKVTFKIANFDATKSYSYIFGSTKKDGKSMDENYGTLTIMGQPAPDKPVTPKESFNVSGSFKATFAKAPDKDEFAKDFVIKNGDTAITDVKYSFKPDGSDSVNTTMVRLDTAVSGTVTFTYKASEPVKNGATFNISKGSDAANVQDFAKTATVSVQTPDGAIPMSLDTWKAGNMNPRIWITQDMAKNGPIAGDELYAIWGSFFDIRQDGSKPADDAGNVAAKKNWEDQHGADKLTVSIADIDMTAVPNKNGKKINGTAQVTISIDGSLEGCLHDGPTADAQTKISFYGSTTISVGVVLVK